MSCSAGFSTSLLSTKQQRTGHHHHQLHQESAPPLASGPQQAQPPGAQLLEALGSEFLFEKQLRPTDVRRELFISKVRTHQGAAPHYETKYLETNFSVCKGLNPSAYRPKHE
jgi:hypothetical protein